MVLGFILFFYVNILTLSRHIVLGLFFQNADVKQAEKDSERETTAIARKKTCRYSLCVYMMCGWPLKSMSYVKLDDLVLNCLNNQIHCLRRRIHRHSHRRVLLLEYP